MRLEYTLTADDLRESFGLPQQARDFIWGTLVGWAVLLVVSVPIGAGWMGEEAGSTLAAAEAAPPQDLWATLAPSLVGLTLVAGGAWVGRRYRVRYGAFVPGRAATVMVPVAAAAVVVAAFAWLVFPNVPAVAIHWHPTPRRQLWVGVAPWFAYGVQACIARLTAPGHTAAMLAAQVRSLNRPAFVDVSDAGITTAGESVEARLAWSHFVSFGETAHLLLIATEDGAPLILPKRAVAEPVDLRRLRSLIQAHVPIGRFLPDDARVPVRPAP